TANLKVALAQLNLVVGDIDGNADKVVRACAEARDVHGADVVVFPELTITGYPPEDLLLRADFLAAAEQGIESLRARVRGIALVVGPPERRDGRLYNAASALHDGNALATYRKQALPNYGVFDEKRYFTAGDDDVVFEC